MTTRPSKTRSSSREDVSPGIEVRCSVVHGKGVFATRHFRAGQRVGVYAGRRYAAGQLDDAWDGGLTYLFSLSDGTTIDGAQGGNETRHLNHGCEPNVEAIEERGRAGSLNLVIRTLRSVRIGEELFLDYALVIDDSEDATDYPCGCGASSCRGTMAPAHARIDPTAAMRS